MKNILIALLLLSIPTHGFSQDSCKNTLLPVDTLVSADCIDSPLCGIGTPTISISALTNIANGIISDLPIIPADQVSSMPLSYTHKGQAGAILIPMIPVFIAGASDGFAETLKWHYDRFKKVFPDAPDEYCNPEVSWKRKWEGGEPANGPAYWGSTTWLVGSTDAYHLARSIRNISCGVAFTLNLYELSKNGGGKKFMYYVREEALYTAVYGIGFNVVYSGVFR